MIDLQVRSAPLRYNVHWFHERPRPRTAIGLTLYMQCRCVEDTPGFVRRPFATKLIDLTANEESLLANCRHNTAYEIKRARREDIRFALEPRFDMFVSVFNEFARVSGLVPLTRSALDDYGDHITITQATLHEEPLVMHCYLVDRQASRARLLYSASTFHHTEESAKRYLIGRANRFLHFEDMLYFKRCGLHVYDLGGYAVDTTDPKRQAINRFKDGFGGTLKGESHFVSLPLGLCRRTMAILGTLRRGRHHHA